MGQKVYQSVKICLSLPESLPTRQEKNDFFSRRNLKLASSRVAQMGWKEPELNATDKVQKHKNFYYLSKICATYGM